MKRRKFARAFKLTVAAHAVMRGMNRIKHMLAACAVSFALASCASVPEPSPPQPAPADYRQLAANTLASLPKLAPLIPASISNIESSTLRGDWEACIKLSNGRLYAVFYSGQKLVDIRLALGVDCKRVTDFYPLPGPVVPKPG